MAKDASKADQRTDAPIQFAAHRGYPIWLRLVAQKVVREFQIESTKEEFESEFVALKVGDNVLTASVDRDRPLKDAKATTGFLELMVDGVHLHVESRIKKALLGVPFCRQKARRDGFVQFRGLVKEVLHVETSSITAASGRGSRLSFSAIIDVGGGLFVLLNAADIALGEIAVGDILEGDAVATLRPCSSSAATSTAIPDSLVSLWSALR
ncbi:MAG: hypothetical protein ACUVT7_03745 [Thermoplasmata archaeon]